MSTLALIGPALPARAAVDEVDRAAASVVTVRTSDAVGSAFAFGAPGRFLTNAHVVGGDDRVQLQRRDGRTAVGEVIRRAAGDDVALIQADLGVPGLSAAPAPRLAQPVYAIGAPEGLSGTVTRGIVSSVRREVDGHPRIQTDASANPGNSGGPLIDGRGRVLGIVTAKGAGEGIAFAVPIGEAAAVVGIGTGVGGDRPRTAPEAAPAQDVTRDGGPRLSAAVVAATCLLAGLLLAALAVPLRAARRRRSALPRPHTAIDPRAADAPLDVRVRRRPEGPASRGADPLVVVHRRQSPTNPEPPTTTEDPWT